MRNWLVDMLKRLTSNYTKNESSNIGRLLKLASSEMAELETTFETIEKYQDVDQALGEPLSRLGADIGQFRGQTTEEVYRLLIKARIKRNLSDGGLNTICDIVSFLLKTDVYNCNLAELWPDEPAAVLIDVLPDALNEVGLSYNQFSQLMTAVVAGGVAVRMRYEGTFSFSTLYDQSETDSAKGMSDLEQTTGGYFGAYYDPGSDVVLPL